jgi:hypothetical protein
MLMILVVFAVNAVNSDGETVNTVKHSEHSGIEQWYSVITIIYHNKYHDKIFKLHFKHSYIQNKTLHFKLHF